MKEFNRFEVANEFLHTLVKIKAESVLVIYDGEWDEMKLCIHEYEKLNGRIIWDAIVLSGNDCSLFNKCYTQDEMEKLHHHKKYDITLILTLENVKSQISMDKWMTFLKQHTNRLICGIEKIDDHSEHKEVAPLCFFKEHYGFVEYKKEEVTIRVHMIQLLSDYEPYSMDDIKLEKVCKKKMKIGFWIPHTRLTGTMKNIAELGRQLSRRGHEITFFRRGKKGEITVPDWYGIGDESYHFKTVLFTDNAGMSETISETIDLLVIAAASNIFKFPDLKIPMIIWEHGFKQMFGEFSSAENYFVQTEKFIRLYRSPVYLLSVSPIIKELLQSRYGRNTYVLPNGVNIKDYHPEKKTEHTVIKILFVGTDRYKRIDRIIHALDRLYQTDQSFEAVWICQNKPEDAVQRAYLKIEIKPSQKKLQQYYRNADILLSASEFESFSNPPLEAMASGTGVVAVDSGGLKIYAEPDKNMILCEQGDEEAFYHGLEKLCRDKSTLEKMETEGRITALQYDYEEVAKLAETLCYSIYIHHMSRSKKGFLQNVIKR